MLRIDQLISRASAIIGSRWRGPTRTLGRCSSRVVNRRKNAASLDGAAGCVRTFELKAIVSAIPGRDLSEFGTVRPRGQIPGPRPLLSSKSPILDVVLSQRVTAGHRFLGIPCNRGCVVDE